VVEQPAAEAAVREGGDGAADDPHLSEPLLLPEPVLVRRLDDPIRIMRRAGVHGNVKPPPREPAGKRGQARLRRAHLRGEIVSQENDTHAEATRVAEIYGGYARSERRRRAWDAKNPGNQAIRDELFDRLLEVAGAQLDREGAILDAGCGTGYWLERLASHGIPGGRLHGLDIRAGTMQMRPGLPPDLELTRGDLRELPFADSTFSVVLLFTVLSSLGSEHDVSRAATEVARVLAPQGVVVVYEPRISNPLNRATRTVDLGNFQRLFGPPVRTSSLTVLPQLARRLGGATPWLYPALFAVPLLRTHRLTAFSQRTG
jgi:ubiquinone/menaquinone biosynthesis C-methylase UbiE